jgi:hypothetical protein
MFQNGIIGVIYSFLGSAYNKVRSRLRRAEGSPGKNWDWHSTQRLRAPVSFRNRPTDGFIRAEAEILISLTWPAGSAAYNNECSASAPFVEKSKMARLPVRCAISDTGGLISPGLQTKAMVGAPQPKCPDLRGNTRRLRDAELQRLSEYAISLEWSGARFQG